MHLCVSRPATCTKIKGVKRKSRSAGHYCHVVWGKHRANRQMIGISSLHLLTESMEDCLLFVTRHVSQTSGAEGMGRDGDCHCRPQM